MSVILFLFVSQEVTSYFSFYSQRKMHATDKTLRHYRRRLLQGSPDTPRLPCKLQPETGQEIQYGAKCIVSIHRMVAQFNLFAIWNLRFGDSHR